MTSRPPVRPLPELWRRLRSAFWTKTFGIPAFMAAFFVGYFIILNHPLFDVIVMPLTPLDRMIPYQTPFWTLYVSLWVYVQLPPSLSDGRRELFRYGWTAGLVGLVGFLFFVFWPTAVPSVQAAGGSTFERIRSLDTTGNSCPSLHVAFAVLTALWLDPLLRTLPRARRFRWLNALWCAGIVYSTLATKQHVVWDAVAGAALGAAGAWGQARWAARSRTEVAVAEDLPQINPETRKL